MVDQNTNSLNLEVNTTLGWNRTVSSLVVNSATWIHAGEYHCVLHYNGTFRINSSINASLVEDVQIITDTALSYQVGLCKCVTLNCSTINHDSVVWQKIPSEGYNNMKYSSGHHLNSEVNINNQLMIHEAGPGDNGSYICTARNQVSSKSITAEVIVGRCKIY